MATVRNVSLVREASSPAIYLVVGDTKFWIIDEPEFNALGFRWSSVRMVPDGSLLHLTERRLHAAPRVRPSDVFFDCWPVGRKPIEEDLWGTWHWNCQVRSSCVRPDVVIAGWLEQQGGPYVNHEAHGTEDVLYDVRLDAVFLDRMYGPGGLSTALRSAYCSGNPPAPTSLRFAEPPSAPGASHEVTLNSWVMPVGGAPGWSATIHGELNAWHQHNTGGLFTRHFVGRGDHPPHWINPLPQDADAWFPFHPLDPEATGTRLWGGDYIVMRGALWQDTYHNGDPEQCPWNRGPTRHHNAQLEMHPIDWIIRVRGPARNARVTAASVCVCTAPGSNEPVAWSGPVIPDFLPSAGTRRLEVRSLRGRIDRRLTVEGSYSGVAATRYVDHVDLGVTVSPLGAQQGRFKASWLVGWRELDQYDRRWVYDAVPAGAQVFGDGEAWDWVVADPEPYFGARAHRSALVAGLHQHYFMGATETMAVGAGDTLFAAVFLDPDAPPDELMLQWHTTGWLHRAYWGADLIPWGTPGTSERRPMGRLPFSGEWVRLEVPAAAVALEGTTVTGMAFTLAGGRATWDYAGVRTAIPKSFQLLLSVHPPSVREGQRTVTVRARDSGDGTLIAGRVLLGDQDIAATNTPFTRYYTFSDEVAFTVQCPGYPEETVTLRVLPGID
jgi:hypothetical protein